MVPVVLVGTPAYLWVSYRVSGAVAIRPRCPFPSASDARTSGHERSPQPPCKRTSRVGPIRLRLRTLSSLSVKVHPVSRNVLQHKKEFILASPSENPKSDTPNQPAPQTEQQAAAQIEVSIDQTSTTYANFCRVAGAPEEVVVDFGINAQPAVEAPRTIDVAQRIVMNYYTAKRFSQVLMMSVQQHERTFGVIEVDVQKRVTNPPPQK